MWRGDAQFDCLRAQLRAHLQDVDASAKVTARVHGDLEVILCLLYFRRGQPRVCACTYMPRNGQWRVKRKGEPPLTNAIACGNFLWDTRA
ncbi:hypothetical protein TPSea814_000564a [Treponema pallidum subsp. pallidum str. Sea 81-4]|nr:hypothetical protein TPSea814_000564a [Treponema pallidum subsp. pallidum str. Sea 81-4]